MLDEDPPRQLSERTGKHRCIRCLAEVTAEAYQRNDHVCDACAAADEYPLQSTPEAKGKDEG
jgi:hypothetical protein